MKVLNTHQEVVVPEGIDVSVKARVVTVKGARGTLVKDFRHMAVDMYMPQKNIVKVAISKLFLRSSSFTYLL